MKTTPMGEPRPETADEIEGLLLNEGLSADEVEAEISHEEWDPDGAGESGVNMTGYSAELRNMEDGEEVCTTLGFETREALVAILEGAGLDEDHITDA